MNSHKVKFADYTAEEFNHTKIRFIGNLNVVYLYTIKGKNIVTKNPNNPIIENKYPDLKPITVCAVNVLDQSDKKLKIFQSGPSCIRPVSDWCQITGKKPGDDYSIYFVVIKRATRVGKFIEIVPSNKKTILSKKQTEYILSTGGTKNGYDLEKIYKPTSKKKILEIINE